MSNFLTRPAVILVLAIGAAGAITLGIGEYVGSKGSFGAAAMGLSLAVLSQLAEMFEQTIPDTPSNKDKIRRTKAFVGAMKLLGLLLLGIGGMVGLSSTPSSS